MISFNAHMTGVEDAKLQLDKLSSGTITLDLVLDPNEDTAVVIFMEEKQLARFIDHATQFLDEQC